MARRMPREGRRWREWRAWSRWDWEQRSKMAWTRQGREGVLLGFVGAGREEEEGGIAD